MSDLPHSASELFPSVKSDEKRALLIAELQKQIKKDLKLDALPKSEQLYFFIETKLKSLGQDNDALHDLLYRIDLDEKVEGASFLEQHGIQELATKILKREAQKVVFRLQYAGKL